MENSNLIKLLIIGFLLIHTNLYSQEVQYNPALIEITNVIKEEYMESINIDSIINDMVNNYLSSPETIEQLFKHLDPHSRYLSEKEYGEMKLNLASNFTGIGITFGIINDTVLVTTIIENGAASTAGLLTGDKIIFIDDTAVSGVKVTYDYIINNLRGPKETEVKLNIQRNNIPELLTFNIVRNRVELKTVVAAYMIDKKTGYIKLSNFSESTHTEMQNALIRLKNQGMNQLIFDLRENSGGYLKSATKIADEFISDNKLLVYMDGKPEGGEKIFAENKGLFEEGKMIVLVNEYTASSGEILTGALQDNKRAIIIGRRTYGKGLVQKIFPLSDSSTAVVLTTNRYYTPSGKCIQRPFDDGVDAYYSDKIASEAHPENVPAIYKNNEWGIHPDIYITDEMFVSNYLHDQLYFRYYMDLPAFYYYSNNKLQFTNYKNVEDFENNYRITDDLFNAFIQHVKMEEINISEESYKIIFTEEELYKIKPQINNTLKASIAKQIWGDEGYYRIMNNADIQIAIALKELEK